MDTVKTPIKDELIAALSDSTLAPERRELAAQILEWMSKFDVPSCGDKEIVTAMAAFTAADFWSGSDTIENYEARNHR
jgi:hypothetical protein